MFDLSKFVFQNILRNSSEEVKVKLASRKETKKKSRYDSNFVLKCFECS